MLKSIRAVINVNRFVTKPRPIALLQMSGFNQARSGLSTLEIVASTAKFLHRPSYNNPSYLSIHRRSDRVPNLLPAPPWSAVRPTTYEVLARVSISDGALISRIDRAAVSCHSHGLGYDCAKHGESLCNSIS